MINQGHGRTPVCIDKSSFSHPLEQDGAVILEVHEVQPPTWIATADEDGGTKYNKDGSESGRMTIILKGDKS